MKARVLIVDDDPNVVAYLTEALEERGFDAHGCTAPREAIDRVQAGKYDILVSDIEMPELRGLDLLAHVQRARPQQLVLFITAFGSIDLAVEAVRAGAVDFLSKPFEIEALVHAIERALRERNMRREIIRLRTAQPVEAAGLVARSQAMRRVLDVAQRAARGSSTVLITGETGTGKSLLARYLHETSSRAKAPFLTVNCAALPETLVEGELFGTKRGAYTDAREDRPGVFVGAEDGTVFLDEIGELPIESQAKLLHVLEARSVRPLGAVEDVPVRARLVAATNRSPEALVREGKLRSDLYYRLNVIRIELPPLRARKDDILPLVDSLLQRASAGSERPLVGIAAAGLRRLLNHTWPGNVRELANTIERAVALAEHDVILAEDILFPNEEFSLEAMLQDATERALPLEAVERAYARRVLEAHDGNLSSAARALGINRRTLYRKLAPGSSR